MASRRKGRILAFQALYSWDTNYSQKGDTSIPRELLDFSWTANEAPEASSSKAAQKLKPQKPPKPIDEKMAAFSRLLLTGTVENITQVDNIIQEHLKNWEISRLKRVDLAILRMSTYSLLYQEEIPPSVVIDEAVEISREFGTDDSYRFVNGVLDSIRKTLTQKNDVSCISGLAAT